MNRYISRYAFYYPAVLLRGEFVPQYLHDYKKSQFFSYSKLADLQEARARSLLDFASTKSSYYRRILAQYSETIRRGGNFWEAFKTIPYLTKQNLIVDAADLRCRQVICPAKKTTGGSTGEPVTVYKNPSALARERAATWRAYSWAGVFPGDPQARFWGTPHEATGKIQAALTDFVANRRRVSAFDISEESLAGYHKKFLKFKPKFLYGYVSVLVEYAQYLVAAGVSPPDSLHAVITTSEVLTDNARIVLEKAFRTKVYNEYGCGEVGSIAHECSYGAMHLMVDNLIIESVDAPGGTEIVVTDLFNYAMPLIRYRLGDFGTVTQYGCECGVSLPVVRNVHGRAYDLIDTGGGRKIHPEAIMYVFEGLQAATSAFKKFQFIQKTRFGGLVKVVPGPGWSHMEEERVRAGLARILGEDFEVQFDVVLDIPREASGKMRVVKNERAG